MQTKLNLFDNCPTKGQIVCRRIIQRCLDAGKRPEKRFCRIISIKEVIESVK